MSTFQLDGPMTLKQFLLSEERNAIIEELKHTRYNASQAARNLGLTFRALRYRMERSALNVRSEPKRARSEDGEFNRRWPALRMKTLKRFGARCQCCGATAKDARTIHVDHIFPRKTHPHLALDPSNLQVLCEPCNLSKSIIYQDDWR